MGAVLKITRASMGWQIPRYVQNYCNVVHLAIKETVRWELA